MAKKKHSGSRKMTLPIAALAPVAMAGVASGKALIEGDTWMSQYIFTGIDRNGHFYWPRVAQTYAPMVAGLVAHKVANRFGLNRALANAKIPMLRI